MVKVKYSSALESTTGETETSVDASTVGETLDKLTQKYGGEFAEKMLDDGEVRRFINVYVRDEENVSGEEISHLDELDTRVKDSDEISILPAIAGGSVYSL